MKNSRLQKIVLVNILISITKRWGQGYINWNSEIARIKLFADTRAYYAKRHISSTFQLSRHEQVQGVSVTPIGAGQVKLNTLVIDNQWSGDYFLEHQFQ